VGRDFDEARAASEAFARAHSYPLLSGASRSPDSSPDITKQGCI
jgi:hypothetical protein